MTTPFITGRAALDDAAIADRHALATMPGSRRRAAPSIAATPATSSDSATGGRSSGSSRRWPATKCAERFTNRRPRRTGAVQGAWLGSAPMRAKGNGKRRGARARRRLRGAGARVRRRWPSDRATAAAAARRRGADIDPARRSTRCPTLASTGPTLTRPIRCRRPTAAAGAAAQASRRSRRARATPVLGRRWRRGAALSRDARRARRDRAARRSRASSTRSRRWSKGARRPPTPRRSTAAPAPTSNC